MLLVGFIWLVLPVRSKSQVYNIKAVGSLRKRNKLRVTKIANIAGVWKRGACLDPAGQNHCYVVRLLC